MTHWKNIGLALLATSIIFNSGLALAMDAPGYLDLDFIDIPLNAEEFQDINLGPVLKDVVRDAKANQDLEIAELLSMVHNLRMVSFSLDDAQANKEAADAVIKLTKKLKKEDWDRLISLKDGEEITRIHTRYHDNNMVGLSVIVFTPHEEALFVNVQGDLDLGKIMRLAGQLDEEELEAYLEKFDGEIHME